MEKKLSLIVNAVLAVAVIVLFVLVLGKNKAVDCQSQEVCCATDSTKKYFHLPIAYINVDSLVLNYTYAKDANEQLMKDQEDSRLKINIEANKFQQEMADFQRKVENNAFLTRQRAEEAQAALQKKQQDLQALDGKLTQKLVEKQQKVSEALRDTINAFLKDFNKDGKYEIIFSNSALNSAILQADKSYDITNEVIAALNKRASKK